jgi:hypothetical protein
MLRVRVRWTSSLGQVGVDMRADGALDAVRYLALAMEHYEVVRPLTREHRL